MTLIGNGIRRVQADDIVVFKRTNPSYHILMRDFGAGPFKIRAMEGEFCSLNRMADGYTYVSYNKKWEPDNRGEDGSFKAVPPTFHISWIERVEKDGES